MGVNIAPLLTNVLLVVFLWGMGLGQGMSLTLAQILVPFRRWGTILVAVGLNSVLVPLLYWAVTFVVPMSSGRAIGFLLVGFAAAAPFGIKAALIEHGDVPLAIGLVVLLGALNVLTVPLWALLLMPPGTAVNAGQIAETLVLLVLLPLALGLFVKARYAAQAKRLSPIATRLSTVALVALIVVTVAVNQQSVLSLLGSLVVVAAIIAIGVSGVLGYLIGYDKPSRRVLSSVTAIRAVGPALAIASTAFAGNREVIVTCVGFSVIMMLPLVLAVVWGRMSAAGTQTPSGAVPA